jgi:DNA mismatch endonuclease (patch repair protein)
MRAIRSKENITTEIAMIKVFRRNKITGWRRNYRLLGKPDFIFPKSNLAVFVDGCFWHGHACLKPRDSLKKGFWKEKIERNQKRDRLINKAWKDKGWKVVRVWECEIEKRNYNKKLNLIKSLLEEKAQNNP